MGAVLSYVLLICTTLIALVYTPLLIRLLGQSEYGLYMMIGSIAAYLSVMDMGLGNAVVRYNARNRAIGNEEKQSNLNGMFLFLYSLVSLLTIALGTIIYKKLENIFGSSLTIDEIEKAKIMVIILILNFAISLPLSVFNSIMQAYEKYVVVKIISIIRVLSAPIITIPFLIYGYGSISMVLITTLINIITLLYSVYYCFKYLSIKVYFNRVDFSLIKEIIYYSFFIFLGIVVDQINWNTGSLILGAVNGTIAVAVFAVALQFIRLYLQLSTSISGLFLPRVTIMVANKVSNLELTNIMIKFGRIQYIIIAFILIGFSLIGKPFIIIWAGEAFSNAYYMVLIVMIPITIPLIQNIGISILQAKNLQAFRSVILILIAILNILISIPLGKNYGGIGVAIGIGTSYIIGNVIIMNIYYHYKIGIDMMRFWKSITSLSIPVLLTLFLGLCMNYIITISAVPYLIIKIIFISFTYFSLIWIFGLNRYEKNLILSLWMYIKKLYIRFKKILVLKS